MSTPTSAEPEFVGILTFLPANIEKVELITIYKLSIALMWLVTKHVYSSSP
jgi:hypothetical protein